LSRLRLAIAGFGRLAEAGYVPAIAHCEGLELVAVAEPDAGRRARAGELAGVATHATLDGLISADRPDLLVVASPPEMHLPAATLAAAHEIPTLVEKPPADRPGEAARLAALRPAPWIGFNRRFSTLLRIAPVPRDTPIELRLELHYRRASWNAFAVRDDALADVGIHLADLALELGGEPLSVEASRLEPERAEFSIELERGRALVRCSTNSPWRELLEVRSEGRRIARVSEGGVIAGALSRLARRPHPLVASLAAQLTAVCRALEGAAQPLLADAGDGLAAMSLLEAVRESASQRARIVAVAPIAVRPAG
jgi:predicted dehydrogenase